MLKTRGVQREDEQLESSLAPILLVTMIGIAASMFVAFEVPGWNLAEAYLAADGPRPWPALGVQALPEATTRIRFATINQASHRLGR